MYDRRATTHKIGNAEEYSYEKMLKINYVTNCK